LAEIEKTAGDPKKDLTICNPQSVAQCMIDAASFKMKIDGRQHAHLVKYGNNCTLQIGYRGYLAKIKEHYPDADFVVTPIYEGDQLEITDNNGDQDYKLVKKNAFADGDNGFKGILFVVTYTDNGRLIRRVNTVPKSRIDRARKAAKQDFVWSSDYIEKAKAAAIKASCKIHFASLSGLSDVMSYDNERNYDPEKERRETQMEEQSSSIINNLNSEILEGEVVEDSPQTEDSEATTPHDNMFPGDLPEGVSMSDLETEHEKQTGV
jgi:recombinational DNA repair protein RecT